MPTWGAGSSWGLTSLWGTLSDAAQAYCELADERCLVQMDDTTGTRNFRDFMCILAEAFGDFQAVAFAVRDAFDVDTAVGVQLDMIGSVVGLSRQGATDDRYRVFLNIQIELLLSAARGDANWTGTHNNILTICRTFIGDAEPLPVVLKNFPPYSFLLSVPGVTLSELQTLVRFICQATYAGVLGQVIVILAADSLWNSASVAVTDGGIWGSASVAVAGSAVWNMSVPIGTSPC